MLFQRTICFEKRCHLELKVRSHRTFSVAFLACPPSIFWDLSKFLSYLSPIIDYSCHSLTHSLAHAVENYLTDVTLTDENSYSMLVSHGKCWSDALSSNDEWGLVEILKLNFGRAFEADVWVRFWSCILVKIWRCGLVKILRLKFGWNFEAFINLCYTLRAGILIRALNPWVRCAFGIGNVLLSLSGDLEIGLVWDNHPILSGAFSV